MYLNFKKYYALSYFKILSEKWLVEETGFIFFWFAENVAEQQRVVFMEIENASFSGAFLELEFHMRGKHSRETVLDLSSHCQHGITCGAQADSDKLSMEQNLS